MRISRKKSMEKGKRGRRKDPEARNNVVSLRINDQEKRLLDRFTQATRKNVSDLVREALELWQSKHKRLVLG